MPLRAVPEEMLMHLRYSSNGEGIAVVRGQSAFALNLRREFIGRSFWLFTAKPTPESLISLPTRDNQTKLVLREAIHVARLVCSSHARCQLMRSGTEIHGTLIVDKPPGPTSHDVVAMARKVYGTRRVGHTGTLDPMATGVLVLLFGEATKLSGALTAADKQYSARVVFGYSTDSDDALGTTKHTAIEIPSLENSRALDDAIEFERNRSWQVPPRVSAIKLNGERAYRSVRNGLEPSQEPRAVTVHGLRVVAIGRDYVDIDLHCSKGYYVRALARDLGEALGCPAHLGVLRRVRNGPFALDMAAKWPPEGSAPPLLPVLDSVQRVMQIAQLTTTGLQRARKGQQLTTADFSELPSLAPNDGPFAWVFANQLIALGECSANDTFRVTRGFTLESATQLSAAEPE